MSTWKHSLYRSTTQERERERERERENDQKRQTKKTQMDDNEKRAARRGCSDEETVSNVEMDWGFIFGRVGAGSVGHSVGLVGLWF